MEDKEYIEKRKKESFNRYKDTIKWEEVDKEDKKWENKIWKEEYDIKFARKYNLDTNTLNELKNLKSNVSAGSEFIAKLKERVERQEKLQRFLDDYKMEFLWKNRNLTEEIAPVIIENYDTVKIKEGTINIIVSLSLEPFFRKKYEVKFQEVRLSEKWGKFVGFDEKGKGTLCQDNIFTFDNEERELEKDGYNIEAFRGVAFNELLTPIYKLKRDNLESVFVDEDKNIKEENILEKLSTNKKLKVDFLKVVLGNIRNILKDWNIKVKITKGGLANIFFEKEFKKNIKSNYDINIFAKGKRELMCNPYTKDAIIEAINKIRPGFMAIEETKKFLKESSLLKEEQVFTSYLNAAAIWIIHIFLKECKGKIVEILGEDKKDEWTDYFEYPWDVRYEAINSYMRNAPPIRNYCIVFHFKGVEGLAWGFDKPLKIERHFDCPANINICPKKEECFIMFLGHSLLSLSINTYRVDGQNECLRAWFTKKELESLAKRDLSRWRGELCLVDSETTIICTPENELKINMEGQEVEYDKYWKSIIKGFSLLLGCKTLAQDIGRILFDCIGCHRNKVKNAKEIQEKLNIVSHMLSRTRFTVTPSNISRARYVREKLEAYIKVTGLSEIIQNIGKDYDDLYEAIHFTIESKRTEQIRRLTVYLVPLAFSTLVGTAMLVFNELKVQLLETHEIWNSIINFLLAFLIAFFSISVYKLITNSNGEGC